MLSLEHRPYRLPLRRPFVTAFGRLERRAGWLVRVGDGRGGHGLGEAAPLPGFGGGEPAAVKAALEQLAGRLAREPEAPAEPAELARLLRRLVDSDPGLPRRAPAALAAVDLALADLAARRAGLPLARWLATGTAESVPVNATIGGDAPAECAAAARRALAEGFGSLKLKLTGEDDGDLARIAAVQDVLDANADAWGRRAARIRLDANGSWAIDRATTMLERLEGYAIEYVEQPTPVTGDPEADVAALQRARQASPVPLAADEILLEPAAAEAVIEARAADLLILKPALLGGPSRALALAAAARAAGLERVVTSALDGAIGRLGALHLAAGLGLDRACGLATGGLLAADLAPFPEVGDGRLRLPLGPGLGAQAASAWPAESPP